MFRKFSSVFLSFLMVLTFFSPVFVFAEPSPTTSNNPGGYSQLQWDGQNIVLAPKGTQAFVNGQLVISMGDGNSFMTTAGNVFSADGTFLYNINTGSTARQNTPFEFHFVRNSNDDVAFDHFQYISVDGITVAPEQYSIRRGSVYVTLKQSFINTLSNGKHTLTVYFDDSPSMSKEFMVNNGVLTPQSYGAKTSDPGVVSYAFMCGGAITTAIGSAILLKLQK